MEKIVKINVPDGHVIEWNKNYNGVEIKSDCEDFVIDANKPIMTVDNMSSDDAIEFIECSTIRAIPYDASLALIVLHKIYE